MVTTGLLCSSTDCIAATVTNTGIIRVTRRPLREFVILTFITYDICFKNFYMYNALIIQKNKLVFLKVFLLLIVYSIIKPSVK